ncbi:hypothetical protein [Martelella alba]|uniref:Uncharacterized protein n=1 Tax=Martelella alba TaxID=2590451 RepID=A0ABY2SF94_9HYPH|nr:hypothetical protein [Martelella alba]TKI03565.1 hypothetical protein FCN80_21035 [Martelella alba]
MLEDYFAGSSRTEEEARTKHQRLLAVQAALEIAKASAGSSDACTGSKVEIDMRDAGEQVTILADAIQAALEIK